MFYITFILHKDNYTSVVVTPHNGCVVARQKYQSHHSHCVICIVGYISCSTKQAGEDGGGDAFESLVMLESEKTKVKFHIASRYHCISMMTVDITIYQ